MYKEVWEAAIGEVLECHREPTNATERYVVAAKKTLEGMLPVFAIRKLDTFYSDRT